MNIPCGLASWPSGFFSFFLFLPLFLFFYLENNNSFMCKYILMMRRRENAKEFHTVSADTSGGMYTYRSTEALS